MRGGWWGVGVGVGVCGALARCEGVKVLAYGDALTSCASSLEDMLAELSPLAERVHVSATGLGGVSARVMVSIAEDDRVLAATEYDWASVESGAAHRAGLGATLDAYAAMGDPVDVVVLLAGSVDLLDGAGDVAESLGRLRDICAARGARAIAVEIPRDPTAARTATAVALTNERVRAETLRTPDASFFCPWPTDDFTNGAQLFGDGGPRGGFSAAGSRLFGEWLGNAVVEALRLWRCATPMAEALLGLPVELEDGPRLLAGETVEAVVGAVVGAVGGDVGAVGGCADEACVAAAVRPSLVVLRDDARLCAGHAETAPWVKEGRAPRYEFEIDMGTHSELLRGDDPRAMAEFFVDRAKGALRGAGCDSKDCFLDLIEDAIRVDASTTLQHPSDSHVFSEAADRLDAPLLLCCSGLGVFGTQKIVDNSYYEFRRLVAKTFGAAVHQLYVRDLQRAWYLGGLPGLGPSPEAAADGVRRLLATRDVRPSKTVVVGDSMGGFGALLFGALLGADVVLAFVPQTFSTPTLLERYGDDRWPAQADAGRAYPRRADLGDLWNDVERAGCPTRAIVLYGDDPLDVAHATHLANRSTCVRLRQHVASRETGAAPHAAFTKGLRDTGVLAALLREAIPDDALERERAPGA